MESKKDFLVISFSGGRSSAMMTEILMDRTAENQIICFMNTGREDEKTLKFVHDFEIFNKIKIVWIEFDNTKQGFKIVNFETASRNGEPFQKMLSTKSYLPNVVRRFCTTELKIRPLKKYIKSLGFKSWVQAVGFRHDEPQRVARINKKKDRFYTICPLNELKITKKKVLEYWENRPFNLEIPEYLGNCDCCFMKSIKKIKRIERETPDKLNWWIEQERKSNGATFRKETSFLHLRNLIQKTPTLFDNIKDLEEIQCFCNAD